jgi:hypothetical protein
MGFFSKTCAKTHLPITCTIKSKDFSKVMALLPDGSQRYGDYDGYGRIDGESVMENEKGEWIWDKVKFVLGDHYKGEMYHDLGKSGDEMAQGYFMSDEFLLYCKMHGPFKNRAGYVRAFKKYANW